MVCLYRNSSCLHTMRPSHFFSYIDTGILIAPETQYTPQEKTAMFFCQGRGSTVQWQIGGTVVTPTIQEEFTEDGYEFQLDTDSDYYIFNLTLKVLATVHKNNTQFRCVVMDDTYIPSSYAYLIVLGKLAFNNFGM